MAKNWDAEMQERFEKLAQTVDDFRGRFEAIAHRFDTVDQRFDAVDKRFDGVDKRLDGVDNRLDGVDNRLDAIDKRFDGVDQRLDAIGKRLELVDGRFDLMGKQVEATEKRILDAFKIHGEDLRTAVHKAAEGYGATLQSIERKVDETNRHWAAKWELHEDVLKNHAGRIAALDDRCER